MRKLFIGTTLILAFLASSIMAAIPPIDEADRPDLAANIVVGEVIFTSAKVKNIRDTKSNINHNARIKITEVKKGSLKVGDTIKVNYWRAFKRPEAWSGNQGQNSVISVGSTVEVFTEAMEKHEYKLLAPNGFEDLQ